MAVSTTSTSWGMKGLNVGFRDYFAALVRTQQGFVAPTQGKLLNYVTRVPLGVVAQITVSLCHSLFFGALFTDGYFVDSHLITHYCKLKCR